MEGLGFKCWPCPSLASQPLSGQRMSITNKQTSFSPLAQSHRKLPLNSAVCQLPRLSYIRDQGSVGRLRFTSSGPLRGRAHSHAGCSCPVAHMGGAGPSGPRRQILGKHGSASVQEMSRCRQESQGRGLVLNGSCQNLYRP